MYVRSYRELIVYKLARKLAEEIFELTKTFPKEEKYSLISQIRKSSQFCGSGVKEDKGFYQFEETSQSTPEISEFENTDNCLLITNNFDPGHLSLR